MRFLEGGLREKLPYFANQKEKKEKRDQLVSAFVAKAVSDINEHGFTIARDMEGSNGFSHQALASRVILENNGKKFRVYMVSRVNKPNGEVDSMNIQVSPEDMVDLSKVSAGKKRVGRIVKEIEILPSGREEREQSSFYQTIKRAGEPTPISYMSETSMSLADSVSFFRELLSSRVDQDETSKDFENELREDQKHPISHWRITDSYWNRERPGEVRRFFTKGGLTPREIVLIPELFKIVGTEGLEPPTCPMSIGPL